VSCCFCGAEKNEVESTLIHFASVPFGGQTRFSSITQAKYTSQAMFSAPADDPWANKAVRSPGHIGRKIAFIKEEKRSLL
jgi:hypothetical protein